MNVISLSKHEPNQTYGYLFDTNVWLYIFGPIAGSNNQKQHSYSELLNSIISRKGTIFITSLVLAEYVNKVLQIGFRQWKSKDSTRSNTQFKRNYRTTEDYKTSLEDAVAQVSAILKVTEKRSDDFNCINIDDIFSSMGQSCDFNDMYFVKCCEKGNMIFVSDDADVTHVDSTIKVINDRNKR